MFELEQKLSNVNTSSSSNKSSSIVADGIDDNLIQNMPIYIANLTQPNQINGWNQINISREKNKTKTTCNYYRCEIIKNDNLGAEFRTPFSYFFH